MSLRLGGEEEEEAQCKVGVCVCVRVGPHTDTTAVVSPQECVRRETCGCVQGVCSDVCCGECWGWCTKVKVVDAKWV